MIRRNTYIVPKDTNVDDGKVIDAAIRWNKSNLASFNKLESYIGGEIPLMGRKPPTDLLAVHDFAGYITSVNTGYLVGNAVDYKANDSTDLDKLKENYEHQSIEELDTDIEEDLSIFGQAFEAVYVDEDTQVQSAKLSVYNTIIIYDDTFKHNKLAAIYYSPKTRQDGQPLADEYEVTIWTPTQTLYRTLKGSNLTPDAVNQDTVHAFKEVPVVHYFNNRRLTGDFELVITLIDAYNILQSDRVLDREKLVDAILAFYGAKMTPEDAASLKENRTIGLPDGAKAEYLIKNIDEADADVLRQTLAADIHKFSKTPDLTDETFGNAPSGVSILYKLLAFEQNIKKKERLFAKGLKDRLRLYCNVLSAKGSIGSIDPHSVQLVFKRSLPKNNFETSQMIANLDGIVDQETLVGQLDFVDDASVVVEKARAERPAIGNFGTDEAEE